MKEIAPFYATAIEETADPRMSAVSALEVALVIGTRKREAGLAALDRFMESSRIRIVAFDAEQLRLASDAWRNYGKGRHPAGLNLGDCCKLCACQAARGDPPVQRRRFPSDRRARPGIRFQAVAGQAGARLASRIPTFFFSRCTLEYISIPR